MKLPRWTTYPAIAVLFVVAIIALPKGKNNSSSGAAADARSGRVALSGTPSTSPEVTGAARSVIPYLPQGYVTDGSVDYRAEVQQAIDASAGATLRLPDFPLRIGGVRGQRYGLVIRSGMQLSGSPFSELISAQAGIQLLRAENVDGLLLGGFSVRGYGGNGRALGHGLVQITGGSDVLVRDLRVSDADADAIVLSSVMGGTVEGCLIEKSSKSSIYLNACDGGIVTGNVIQDFGGHTMNSGKSVGAAIQLSSNKNVVCSGNVISRGTGTGIMCNANAGGQAPEGNVIEGNSISDVGNPTNISVSGGIRLTNGAAQKATGTLVTANSVRRCGVYGLYIENHGGSAVMGNIVIESVRTGIMVSSIQDLVVTGNVVLNSDASQNGGQAAIYLLNNAERVSVTGNITRNAKLMRKGRALNSIKDASRGGGHSLEPRIDHATEPPSSGSWNAGDIVYNTRPISGGQVGWVCTSPGSPGVWSGFGRIE